jgi:hypothetical protein
MELSSETESIHEQERALASICLYISDAPALRCTSTSRSDPAHAPHARGSRPHVVDFTAQGEDVFNKRRPRPDAFPGSPTPMAAAPSSPTRTTATTAAGAQFHEQECMAVALWQYCTIQCRLQSSDSASRICYLLENGKQASGRSVELRWTAHTAMPNCWYPSSPQPHEDKRSATTQFPRKKGKEKSRKMHRIACTCCTSRERQRQ